MMFSLCLLVDAGAFAADFSQDGQQRGDIQLDVVLDPDEQAGSANALVRIHAPREVVWSLLTNCTEAIRMVPGLIGCDVLETAPDQSWQRIRHVVDYSWYLKTVTYEIHAGYDKPARIVIERVAGDLKTLKISWNLRADGDFTIARYQVRLAPGFWVPQWLVRVALRHDLPKMMRALRSRAELVAPRQ